MKGETDMEAFITVVTATLGALALGIGAFVLDIRRPPQE